MASARDVVERALRRLRTQDTLTTIPAEEAAQTLTILNDMLATWPANGVNILPVEFALDDAFVFFVPPANLGAETMDVLTYAGTWNAFANDEGLASGTGTEGTVYRVRAEGSTTLDGVSSWSVDDFAVLGRTYSTTRSPTLTWQKGLSSSRHIAGVVALLAQAAADDFGVEISKRVADAADDGWRTLLSDFTKVPYAQFDPGLTRLPSRRWPYSVPSNT